MEAGGTRFADAIVTVLLLSGLVARRVVVTPAKIVANASWERNCLPLPYPIELQLGGNCRTVGEGKHNERSSGTDRGDFSPGTSLSSEDLSHPLSAGSRRGAVIQATVSHPVKGGIYPVIYFTINQDSRVERGVVAQQRLAVLTLLTEPGSLPVLPVISQTGYQQRQRGGAISLTSLVVNPGPRHITLQGGVELEGPGHGEIYLPVQPVTVLPGCVRRLEVTYHPDQLPIGTYTGRWRLDTGGAAAVAQAFAFDVITPFELAQPGLELEGWQVVADRGTGGMAVVGVVRNDGNTELSPVVAALPTDGQEEAAVLDVGTLAPGQARLVEIPLPRNLSKSAQVDLLARAQFKDRAIEESLRGIEIGQVNLVAASN